MNNGFVSDFQFGECSGLNAVSIEKKSANGILKSRGSMLTAMLPIFGPMPSNS